MIVAPEEDLDLRASLAMLWQRHRQTNLDRISLLEDLAADVLRGSTKDDAVEAGGVAAHKLAGSLGTFGFDGGSRAALEVETLLREPDIDGRMLAEAVLALRASVVEGDESEIVDQSSFEVQLPTASSGAHVLSLDGDLISRLMVEATATGLAVTSSAALPGIHEQGEGGPAMFVVDAAIREWGPTGMLRAVAELSQNAVVVVLTDDDSFEECAALTRAGAKGVVPRSQGARLVISFLWELLGQRRTVPSLVLATNIGSGLLAVLTASLAGSDCHLDVRQDASSFWAALEEHGADLAVVGSVGRDANGPDLCRVIRSHPRWHHLPVVLIDNKGADGLAGAMDAGADDHLSAGIATVALTTRLKHHLYRGRLTQARSEVDPLTGTGNRNATERFLDRNLRLAAGQIKSFSLALISVDQFQQVRDIEGNAVCDVVLRRLGALLLNRFRNDDIVGRWFDDGFAVGIYGVERDRACERVTDVLREFSEEEVFTTSGRRATYTFSAGVASSPVDGSSLTSLERLGESALRRAQLGGNCVMSAGERPIGQPQSVFDVVLIEDDDSVADVVEYAVGLQHYDFLRFNDGAEAARALGEGRVKGHIVLLDIGLPSLDGFGVLQVLRDRGILEDTRVIMLTVRSSEAEMLRALGLGATEHMAKPFSIPILLGRLGQTLARSAA